MRTSFPPYELVDRSAVQGLEAKSRRLERLYHLTQEHAWDGKAVLAGLVERHGPPPLHIDGPTREALAQVLSILLWAEFAAWTISADLALSIDDMDAKMAATAQVFDEARHFYVLRDYLLLLTGSPGADGVTTEVPRLGGVARSLLLDVIHTPNLAKKLIGMQLLFETNAVVIFRRIADAKVCPILTELLPYFERDESRHVGLGVLYLPRLIERMNRNEALSTSAFHLRCLLLLTAFGMLLEPHFARLGLDPRLLALRVVSMQDDVFRQMMAVHGRGIAKAVLNPKGSTIGPKILDFVHPARGMDAAPRWHRVLDRGVRSAVRAADRALA